MTGIGNNLKLLIRYYIAVAMSVYQVSVELIIHNNLNPDNCSKLFINTLVISLLSVQ